MNSKNNNPTKRSDEEVPQNTPEAQEMQDKLDLIKKANECSVLMTLLCQSMGLNPTSTTHNQFIERFAELQNKSLDYQKDLQSKFISGITEQPKTRRKKVSS